MQLAALLMASGLSLLTVAAASAQPLRPIDAAIVEVPTTLSAIPGLSTTPGQPPTIGVPLNQAQAAFRALSGSSLTAGASPTSTISAVFPAPVGVLSVTGTAQNDTIVVSRDAAASCWPTVPAFGGLSTRKAFATMVGSGVPTRAASWALFFVSRKGQGHSSDRHRPRHQTS